MTKTRRGFVNLILAGFILGSLYDIVTNQEHWPFSQYPMFAGLWQSPTTTHLRLVGVTGEGRELPLDSNRFVTPFDMSRLPKALGMITRRKDGEEAIRTALLDCLGRYETLRAQRRHEGPPLTAMRLYEMEWTIEPYASNIDRPDRRRFIAEVQRQ